MKIAHASIDENGKAKGGKAGDQTGKEVCIREWYAKGWNYIIRFKDAEKREKVAVAMEHATANNNIGYDQNQRNTLLTKVRSYGYDPAKATACETDCSALVSVACMYAGVAESALFKSNNSATTTTLLSRLKATGLVDVFSTTDYTSKPDKLMRGDILLKTGSHVVVALENGSAVKAEPAKATQTIHVVQRGDTLAGIARKYNTTIQKIMKDNPRITNANIIVIGWKLKV